MLPHLLQVLQTLVLSPHDGGHPAQGRPLQLLAPVQGVSELEEPHIVLGHVVNQVTGRVDLTQSQLVMILESKTRFINKSLVFTVIRHIPCHKARS